MKSSDNIYNNRSYGVEWIIKCSQKRRFTAVAAAREITENSDLNENVKSLFSPYRNYQ